MDQTLAKGMLLVEALSLSEHPRGVTDLAEQLNLTKSNVHRLLTTLFELGYVRQEAMTARYDLSSKLWAMGLRGLQRLDVHAVARPHLEHLAAISRETVHLSVLDAADIIYIDKIDSPEPVRAYSRLGGRAPAHCVATGKALLAHAGETAIRRLGDSYERHTALTITTPEKLRMELEQIRRQGFAVNHGEWRESVCGLAAPIQDATGRVVAAVGISGPAERLKPRRLRAHASELVAVAQAISADLGFVDIASPKSRRS